MFNVTIGKKNYTNQEIESIAVYSDDEDGQAHAWVTFKKDASKLVGLPISISSSNIRNFNGEVDSVESQTEYICKLYCVGFSSPASLDDNKAFPHQNTIATKEPKKPKKKI